MKVRIERHITTPAYAHYPGQIMIDHPDEAQWLKDGVAVRVEEPAIEETATAPKGETARKPRR